MARAHRGGFVTPVLRETIRRFLPRRLRTHRIRRGPLAGSLIYTSWHDYPGAIRATTERALLDWFGRNVQTGETWLDVGAHYGYTAIALARLTGPGGRVFAFEPVEATANCAIRTRELNGLSQLRVVSTALGDTAGAEVLRLPKVRGMADSTIASSAPARRNAEMIRVTSLDSLWPSLAEGDLAVHGVKIDVQGMEEAAIRGMGGVLRRWHPKLAVEFHEGVDRRRIGEFLGGCGYESIPIAIGPSDHDSYEFVVRP